MLLAKITLSGTDYYISMGGFQGALHNWRDFIVSCDPVLFRSTTDHGGYTALTAGAITISPELLDVAGIWPPPVSCAITVYWAYNDAPDDTNILTLFEGTAHLETYSRESIGYRLMRQEYSTKALAEGPYYDELAIEIVAAGVYKWTASAHGTNEYRLELNAGGDPGIDQPSAIVVNKVSRLTSGTLGSLVAGGWGWGDNDTLGYSTVYVRLSDGTDPDTKANGYLVASYNTLDQAYPRAFGEVLFADALRLNNYGGNPTYHSGYITGTLAKWFTAVANNGSGHPRFACTGHGFSSGNLVYVEDAGRIYWGGPFAVTVIDADHFDVTSLTYSATTTGHAYKSGYWRVYDDGVPISGNVTDNGDNTFSLSATPTGAVSISGTGGQSDVDAIVDWACGADYLNLTLNTTYAESPSPGVRKWYDSQAAMLDMLSDLAATFCHLFYILGGTLYLVDLNLDNGSLSLTEDEYAPSNYPYKAPIAFARCKWQDRQAVEDRTGKHVKAVDLEAARPGSYGYAQTEESINQWHLARANINTILDDILTVLERQWCELTMPAGSNLPVPGQKITFTDNAVLEGTYYTIRARNISYDFNSHRIVIEGDGSGLPVAALEIPLNLVVCYDSAAAAPTGWQKFTDADGKHLKGVPSGGALGDGGGSTNLPVNVTCGSGGGHSSEGGTLESFVMNYYPSNTKLGTDVAGAHQHILNETETYEPLARELVLIKCIAAGLMEIPQNAVVLSEAALAGLSNVFTDNRLLKANVSSQDVGADSQSKAGSSAGNHQHGDHQTNTSGASLVRWGKASGAHTTALTLTMTPAMKRKLLSAWKAAAAAVSLVSGMVAMYVGDPADLTAYWALCDGTPKNGKSVPDLRDYFIQLVVSGSEDTAGQGDNTVDVTYGGIHSFSHSHLLASDSPYNMTPEYHGTYAWSHSHANGAQNDIAFTPPYYCIYFVKYVG
jgi:hypothetical protein